MNTFTQPILLSILFLIKSLTNINKYSGNKISFCCMVKLHGLIKSPCDKVVLPFSNLGLHDNPLLEP